MESKRDSNSTHVPLDDLCQRRHSGVVEKGKNSKNWRWINFLNVSWPRFIAYIKIRSRWAEDPHVLRVLGIVRILSFRHSNRCAMALHFSIKFIFPNDKLYLTSFHVLFCHSHILFCEVSYRTFTNSFFLIEFYVFFFLWIKNDLYILDTSPL